MMSDRRSIFGILAIVLLAIAVSGCDPERKNKCEWTLMPEPNDASRQSEGYYAVCARNFVTMRQKCNLQIKQETAKEVYGKYFRLSDVKIETEGKFPRKILSMKLCEKSD